MDVAIVVIWRRVVSATGRNRCEVLLTQRPDGVHLGGLWEYPGGKVEQGATLDEAARREVREETGLILGETVPLATVTHAYPDCRVRLHAVAAEVGSSATVHGRGVASWRWAFLDELDRVALPRANEKVTRAAIELLNKLS